MRADDAEGGLKDSVPPDVRPRDLCCRTRASQNWFLQYPFPLMTPHNLCVAPHDEEGGGGPVDLKPHQWTEEHV